ncbi:MAG: hypothetical protein CMM48_09470 [Rhodospirillaceae bacterium]|nr:hypothetical protein [Rhodospirillaceae bacterium]HAA91723.1 hypothetical protein [Rhodospirillaceae bacterium]
MVAEIDPLERELAEIDAEVEDAPPVRRHFGMLPIIILFFVLLAFGGLLWYAYSAGVRAGSEEAAPLLKLNGPIKVPPPNPGGVTVAHQEKTVFNPVEGTKRDRNVERILPPPEKPLRPVLGAPNPPKPPKKTPKTTPETTKAAKPAKKVQAPLVRPPVQPKDKKSPTKLTPIDPTKQVAAAKPKRKKATTPPPKGSYMIQTGALSTRSKAKQAWSALKRKHPDLLGKLSLNVARAVVRGTVYFRVQAGPLPDRATTADICNALKERGQGCIVVTPR